MTRRSPKSPPAAAADPELSAQAPAAPPKRASRARKPKAAAVEAVEAVEAEAETEAPALDAAYAGLPPEIAAMLAASAAAAASEAADAGPAMPEGAASLELPAVLDLTAASELREALLRHRGGALTLDASSVERLGGQCLQLLLSAKATWAADDQALALAAPSASLLRDLSILGVEPQALSTHGTAP